MARFKFSVFIWKWTQLLGAYGGYLPGQYGSGPAAAGGADRINLKSDPNHGKLLRKTMGHSDKKMFVGGLAQETNTASLWAYFETFGKLQVN